MARIPLLLLLLGALTALASAAQPQTFCKCTCFKNSTIIPLGPQHGSPPRPPPPPPPSENGKDKDKDKAKSTATTSTTTTTSTPAASQAPVTSQAPALGRRSASSSCSQCTRAFCLSQGIDFCKSAEDRASDVQTMCFQRDSSKDQIIVWGFILGTAGLLGWAAARRFLERREAKARGYLGGLRPGGPPASGGSGGGGGGGGFGAHDRGAYQVLENEDAVVGRTGVR